MTEPLQAAPSRAVSPEALLEPLLEPAYATALHLTGDAAAAEALVQDAALAAFRTTTPQDFKCRFFRALVSPHRERSRPARRGAAALDLDDTPDLFLYARFIRAGLPVEGRDPVGTLVDALGPGGVAEAVNFLPPDYRVVCLLHFMLDMTYAELGEVLDWPAGAVRARIHRGRKMLQQVLWHLAERDGVLAGLSRKGGEHG